MTDGLQTALGITPVGVSISGRLGVDSAVGESNGLVRAEVIPAPPAGVVRVPLSINLFNSDVGALSGRLDIFDGVNRFRIRDITAMGSGTQIRALADGFVPYLIDGESIDMVLTSAPAAEIEFIASWWDHQEMRRGGRLDDVDVGDRNAPRVTPGRSLGETNGTTVVTVVPAPPVGVKRVVHCFQLFNVDTMTVLYGISYDAAGPLTPFFLFNQITGSTTTLIDTGNPMVLRAGHSLTMLLGAPVTVSEPQFITAWNDFVVQTAR